MCKHAFQNQGNPITGPNAPAYAYSAFYPGDEPATLCSLTCDYCMPEAEYCPLWIQTDFVCPVCIEFDKREDGKSSFSSRELKTKNGEFFCPECRAEFKSMADLQRRTMANLKDALDDQNFLKAELERETA